MAKKNRVPFVLRPFEGLPGEVDLDYVQALEYGMCGVGIVQGAVFFYIARFSKEKIPRLLDCRPFRLISFPRGAEPAAQARADPALR